MRVLILFVVLMSAGCSYEDEQKVLDRLNSNYQSLEANIGFNHACFDTDGSPFFVGEIKGINGTIYKCIFNKPKAIWKAISE